MRATIAATLLLCSAAAFAAPNQRPPQGGGQQGGGPQGGGQQGGEQRRGPPPEALEVCRGKAAGTPVEMKTPRGDMVKGTCTMVMIPDHR